MKIYVVAHENIVCPKEYRKVEIMEEDVEGYIKRSVAYQDMLETLPVEEEHLSEIINFWLENQKDAFYEIGYYDLGDFYLAMER